MDEGSCITKSCGVGHRCSWDLVLLWLWCRLAAVASIRPLVWEPPCAVAVALKKKKKKKKRQKKNLQHSRTGEKKVMMNIKNTSMNAELSIQIPNQCLALFWGVGVKQILQKPKSDPRRLCRSMFLCSKLKMEN